MDPPSSSPTRGDGPNPINQMAFCHECGIEIRPLMTPDPTCPRCNGQFVEIIDEDSAGLGSDPDDDDDPLSNPFAPASGPFLTGTQAGGLLNHLLNAMASGSAQGSRSAATGDSANPPQAASTTTRSGTSSFGPFGVQWNVQYGSGGGDPYQRAAQHQAEQGQRQRQQQQQQQQHDFQSPPTLSNFLRFAFGGAESTDNSHTQSDDYFHDDGMGGAGGVADGRHFNHDNRGTYHQPPHSPNNHPSGRSAATAGGGSSNNDLPPELSALRNLFSGLFGEPGTQGGSLLDILAAGAQGGAAGPRGQWGDYVLGQQGLDDIISQLMEQTQGSNAPPPATEDVIDKLERFTLQDRERIEKARNQDCPTCKDDFLPTPETKAESDGEEKGEDADEQQQDLISMPCGHIFHVDCLVPWLRLHGTCPVCRISIAKPAEGQAEQASSSSNNTVAQLPQGSHTGDTIGAEGIPGGWPSPPNPFPSLFNNLANRNAGGGVHVPRDSPAASTSTFHPDPATSTTITSAVYPSAGVGPAGSAGATGSADAQVINSIMSSPPIVSDREEFFADPAPTDQQQQQQQHSGGREDMRETLRRAAEARARNEGAGAQSQGQAWLEPDELD